MTKKEYQNIIGNDIGLVNRYIPDGLGKTHIIQVLNNSVEMHYPSERQESTDHSKSTDNKALHIADVSNSLVADIRNKLTPVKNLCAMLKNSDLMYDLDRSKHKLIEKEIEQTLKSVEYLSNL